MAIDVLAVFAEDVRQELGNKVSLMGILHNELTVPEGQLPNAMLLKLVVALFVRLTKNRNPKLDMEVEIKFPDDSTHRFPLDLSNIDMGVVSPDGQFQTNLLLSPAPFHSGKSYTVYVIIENKRRFVGRLRLKTESTVVAR